MPLSRPALARLASHFYPAINGFQCGHSPSANDLHCSPVIRPNIGLSMLSLAGRLPWVRIKRSCSRYFRAWLRPTHRPPKRQSLPIAPQPQNTKRRRDTLPPPGVRSRKDRIFALPSMLRALNYFRLQDFPFAPPYRVQATRENVTQRPTSLRPWRSGQQGPTRE